MMTRLQHVRALIIALALMPAAMCNDPAEPPRQNGGSGKRALFIGNSYLYTMNVPGIVQALATANGDQLTVRMEAEPNYALIDHWNRGAIQSVITSQSWDWVVLQQGPSSVELNRDTLRLATAYFDPLIKQAHGTPALFSAWPSEPRRDDFGPAIESYAIAAADVGGIFLPVATAWLEAWNIDPSLQLYEDGLHPSPEGAYLAALVVYARLFDRSPIGQPYELNVPGGGQIQFEEGVAATLQAAAAAALSTTQPAGAPQ